jgi:hypothetical protein
MSTGGGKLAREALTEVGLQVSDLEGKSRTQQIGLIADALNRVSNEGQRAALAGRIFGERAGPQLATLLGEGSAGIDALAASTVGVFTKADADRATAYQDRLGEVTRMIDGLKTTIALELLPVFGDMIVSLKDWIAENDELIKQDIPGFIRESTQAFKDLATIVDALAIDLNPLVATMGLLGDETDDATGSINLFTGGLEFAVNALHGMALAIRMVRGETTQLRSSLGQSLQLASSGLHSEAPLRVGVTKLDQPTSGPRIGGRRVGRKAKPRRAARVRRERKVRKAAIKEPLSGVTADQAISAMLMGRGEVLNERLRGLAASTPATRDIKPTVAIDFFSFQIEQHITSPDPEAAGDASAEAIRRAFKKATAQAGQTIAGNVVR